ncbi:hypothetical protein [Sideroxydans sp. CL21]|uniref:hypothetical protein n=1 Tax=Sideroxydans sp. CL21 TaxID=2600596 RepID=UPI0024BC3263|nr:hypothetical protein [Sideroxydans sp. CL21]
MDEDIFKNMTASFFNPEIQGCLSAVQSITGYQLSAVDRQPFLYFHNYLTNPEPEFVSAWRADPALETWYHKFSNGVLMDLQNTLACVSYHYERLVAIETEVIESIEKFDYRKVLGNSTIALGNTLVWDFEYQAFILAYRRCLDYLARAICTYFKNDFHSFRRLGTYLKKLKPESIAKPLIVLHEKYRPMFEFVLSEGDRKSLRDQISHYGYVQAGTINLSQRGFMLAGGGEELGFSHASGAIALSEVLNRHMANLKSCVREMVYQYVDAIRAAQVTSR